MCIDCFFTHLNCLKYGLKCLFPLSLKSLTVFVHQVKPLELSDFLQVKKSEGYCIVGVEQTANSQSLQDYKFPEKTLLLLGYDRFRQRLTGSDNIKKAPGPFFFLTSA